MIGFECGEVSHCPLERDNVRVPDPHQHLPENYYTSTIVLL